MYCSEYVTKVEESIRCEIFAICEPDTMKPVSCKAPFVIQITSELMDPEEVHALGFHASRASHIYMEYSEHFSIPVRMQLCTIVFIFVSQSHDVWVVANID